MYQALPHCTKNKQKVDVRLEMHLVLQYQLLQRCLRWLRFNYCRVRAMSSIVVGMHAMMSDDTGTCTWFVYWWTTGWLSFSMKRSHLDEQWHVTWSRCSSCFSEARTQLNLFFFCSFHLTSWHKIMYRARPTFLYQEPQKEPGNEAMFSVPDNTFILIPTCIAHLWSINLVRVTDIVQRDCSEPQ